MSFTATPTPPNKPLIKMGKKKSDIYSCFQILPMKNKANKSIFMCKFCDRQYLQNATKMESHIVTQCQKVPPEIRLGYAKVPGGGSGGHTFSTSNSTSNHRPSTSTSSPASDSNSNLDDRPDTPINLSQFAAANRARINQTGNGNRGNSNNHNNSILLGAGLLQQLQNQRNSYNVVSSTGNGISLNKRGATTSSTPPATLTKIAPNQMNIYQNNNNNNNNNNQQQQGSKKPKLVSMEAAAGTVFATIDMQIQQGKNRSNNLNLNRINNNNIYLNNHSSKVSSSSGSSNNNNNNSLLMYQKIQQLATGGGNMGRNKSTLETFSLGNNKSVIMKKTNHLNETTVTARGTSSIKNNVNRSSGSNNLEQQQSMDYKEMIDIWKLLARSLYSSGCGLSLFENEYFNAAFKKLRPSFTLPTTYALSNTLLGEEYLGLKQKIDNQIGKCNFVTVQCQFEVGIGDKSNEQTLSFFVSTPTTEPSQSQNSQIMYRLVPLTLNIEEIAQKSTKENLTSIISSTLEDIGANKVLAFVSPTSLSYSHEKLRSTFPGLITLSCIFESLTSFLDSLVEFPSIYELAFKGKQIVDQIKSSLVLKKKFQEIQRQLKLAPVQGFKFSTKSKYSSLTKCLALLTSQKGAFRHLVENEETKDLFTKENGAIKEEFWDEIEAVTNIIVPLSNWIKIMEPETSPSISLVPRIFSEIKAAFLKSSCLPGSAKEEFMQRLTSTKRSCMNELHYAACLLNPKEKTILSENEEEEGSEFIHYFYETRELDVTTGLQELLQYRKKIGAFSEEGVFELAPTVQDPVSWWKTLRGGTVLSHCAISLLNISPGVYPHSTTNITPVFGENEEDSSLDQEQQEKLAFLKCHLQKKIKTPKRDDLDKKSIKVKQPTSSGQSNNNSLLNMNHTGGGGAAGHMEWSPQPDNSDFRLEEQEPMDVTQFLSQSHEDPDAPEVNESSSEEEEQEQEEIKINNGVTETLSKSSSSGSILLSNLIPSVPPSEVNECNGNETTIKEDTENVKRDQVQNINVEKMEEIPVKANDDDDSSSSSDSSDDSSSSSSSSSSSTSNTETKVSL